MILLDGKKVKTRILDDLQKKIKKLDRKLGLTVIQIGEDLASDVYVRQKEKLFLELGYNFNHVKLAADTSEKNILNLIEKLNQDDNVDGILVQMPIPKHLNPKVIQNKISPLKDVDGLTDINAGALVHNVDTLVPCTPLGIIDILSYYNIEVEGTNIVIIGRSDLVGKPMYNLLINKNATVTLCHSKTKNLSEFTRNADILIVAVGKPKMITNDMIKDNCVIIDVGINRIDGKLYGDVDYDNVLDKVSYITPVPGGVGQTTVAELARNVYKAYELKESKK